MAIDSAFIPGGPTVLVGVTAVQVPNSGGINNGNSYRVRCLVTGYLTWGSATIGAPVAPVDGTPAAFTIGMNAGGVETLGLPDGIVFFRASVAGAFEMTPGEGV